MANDSIIVTIKGKQYNLEDYIKILFSVNYYYALNIDIDKYFIGKRLFSREKTTDYVFGIIFFYFLIIKIKFYYNKNK